MGAAALMVASLALALACGVAGYLLATRRHDRQMEELRRKFPTVHDFVDRALHPEKGKPEEQGASWRRRQDPQAFQREQERLKTEMMENRTA